MWPKANGMSLVYLDTKNSSLFLLSKNGCLLIADDHSNLEGCMVYLIHIFYFTPIFYEVEQLINKIIFTFLNH